MKQAREERFRTNSFVIVTINHLIRRRNHVTRMKYLRKDAKEIQRNLSRQREREGVLRERCWQSENEKRNEKESVKTSESTHENRNTQDQEELHDLPIVCNLRFSTGGGYLWGRSIIHIIHNAVSIRSLPFRRHSPNKTNHLLIS